MTEVKHTVGPFRALIEETATVRDSFGNQLAICTHIKTKQGGRRDANEVSANCTLFAAAPDLLEALELAERKLLNLLVPHTSKDMKTIRAAISKARGEQAALAAKEG